MVIYYRYNRRTSKYLDRALVYCEDVPDDTAETLNDMDPTAGWWPVVVVELVGDIKDNQGLDLSDVILVICIYQMMWDEPAAWPVPVDQHVTICKEVWGTKPTSWDVPS